MNGTELDPLGVRPQLKDMLVGAAAMLAVYALLIGSAFGLKGLDLGGMVRTLLPVLIILALIIPAVALAVYMNRRGLPLDRSQRRDRQGMAGALSQASALCLSGKCGCIICAEHRLGYGKGDMGWISRS